ncbi:MAG: spermidine synthase [Candidatus Korobacteraceae bacterium]
MATQPTIDANGPVLAETPPAPPRALLFALAIFSSAFLLFQVQPLIAKIIVPWFGGVASVWTVCLLFFQAVLLLGYAYAHLLTQKFRPSTQGWIHSGLLAASLLALPILPGDAWKPSGSEHPAFYILLLLTVSVGLPFFLLSSTSPLLQAWYARAPGARSPYRLYALSNLGSMLALLSYPLIVEPLVATRNQAWGWSVAYAGVAVLCAVAAVTSRRRETPVESETVVTRPRVSEQALWLALAACGSALLLSITNHITQNIASVPFLWVLPLSLYLLTFILCFDGSRWYRRGLFLRLLLVALGGMVYAMGEDYANVAFEVLIPLFSAGLFVCCMFCHGELARLKPDPAHLTSFYLMLSLGGALGALFVALLAPYMFRGLYELPVALGACAVLLLVVLARDPRGAFGEGRLRLAWLAGLAVLVVVLLAGLVDATTATAVDTRVMLRNFYGVLRVYERVNPKVHPAPGDGTELVDANLRYRELLNGTISHGLQFLGPSRRLEPTTYYSRDSGVGLAIQYAGRPGMKVGVIGLGAGTIAAYGRQGDTYTFYEINPLVVRLAESEFTFLGESPANVEVVLGDARLSLEREEPRGFDVFAVDAFSGDSIPTHLLTLQAFVEYFRHLKPDGVLAVHISNRYLDLLPVVRAAARWLDRPAMLVSAADDDSKGVSTSHWVLITSRPGFFDEPDLRWSGEVLDKASKEVVWTDNYSSLLPLLE